MLGAVKIPDTRPVVLSFCVDFLKADMQHVYRQVSDLTRWVPHIITQRRENETLFPWPKKQLTVIPKHPLRFWRRLWYRQWRRQPVPLTLNEVRMFLYQVLQTQAQLVHVYFGHIGVQWLPMIKACPRPVVVSFHGADVGGAGSPEALRELFVHARLILARSEALLADLVALGCPAEKLRLQRTGVPLDFWSPPPEPRQLPLSDGSWHFVQCCRFVEKKGLRTTLEVFARLREKYPQARLTLIGDGPDRPLVEKLIQQKNLGAAVSRPGFLSPEKVREVLWSAHAFFHPSQTGADGNREGVPNAMLEAMATGLPVLATRHGGISEAVDDEVSGLLVAEKDADALAMRALALLSAPEQWMAMSQAARDAVLARFERGQQTQRLEEIYDEARAKVV